MTTRSNAPLVGIPIHRSRLVNRGMTYWIMGQLHVGTALLRGIAYTVPGTVERGYVLDGAFSETATLLDAVTGRVVEVPTDDCIEVDPRYRGDWTRSEALHRG